MSALDGLVTPEQQYHQNLGHDHATRTIRTIPQLRRESSREELAAVQLLDALDIDERPSFAIHAETAYKGDAGAPLELVYCNAAFSNVDGLLARITGQSDGSSLFMEHGTAHMAFRKWLRGVADPSDFSRRGNAYIFDEIIWTTTTIEDYKIVSGLYGSLLWPDPPRSKQFEDLLGPPKNMPVQGRAPALPPLHLSVEISGQNGCASPESIDHGSFDLTSLNPPPRLLSKHVAHLRGVDWAKTTLGAMATWSPELRVAVNMCLNDINPCVLFWGDNVIMIYNEAYVQLIGIMHPEAMGKSAREIASDYWPTFQPLIDHINATGQAVCDNEVPISIDRLGFLEETYWSFQFIPVLNHEGRIAGYYHPLIESTETQLLKRRVSGLVDLGSQTAKATTLQSFWNIAQHTLTLHDKDVPIALLYSADVQPYSEAGSISSPGSITTIEAYKLKGTIGVTPGHSMAPQSINIQCEGPALQPFLAQAAKSKKATVVRLEELGLTESELTEIEWKGYGEPCRTIIICPLLPTTGEQVEGFFILGTNPRRPFDANYQQFVHVMLRLLATSWASVVLFEEEVRQKEKAIGRAAELQEQLLAEIQMKEKKFQRFAERSDVGIFILDAMGQYTYRNQRWYELFEIAVESGDVMSAWSNIAFPDDLARCEALFGRLVMHKEPVCFELKTKMSWQPPAELSSPETEAAERFKWILCSAYPELGLNGELVEIVGNVTDISQQKWAEDVQKTRTESAIESKQHLEHFIDTTSHEMRNPLSAIMQSADGILSSYAPEGDTHRSPHSWTSFLDQTLDAAQTIAQCAQHMRHIVDDILTISKLDSGLLVITPIDAQPEDVARHAVKMFDAEAKAAGVDLSFVVDKSYREMEVNWVSLDPTRILQVLINLLTNAIKFTRLEPTRQVTVLLSANREIPTSTKGGIQFIEEKLAENDQHLEDDWKLDQDLFYLQFTVTDTGRGLSEDERGSLFTRFSQASPRTHIHYGGSGLGLFISRRLTELQGGAIGLASESNKGSAFSFFVKTRRTRPAMIRRGSVPRILPEDIRHRPGTPLLQMSRPSAPVRMASHRTDDGKWSTPPSPRLLRQHPLHRRSSSFLQSESPSEALETPPLELPQPEQPDSPATLHVLVVEDNLVNQRVLAKQLRNLGCVVSVANHGREAIDFLEKTVHWNHDHPTSYPTSRRSSYHIPCTEPPPHSHSAEADDPIELSIILMDWEMPIMNGLEAVAKIRQLEADGYLRRKLPVIGVTANVRPQQIERAIAVGMDDVVGKPFRVPELLDRMRGIVQKMVDESRDGYSGADAKKVVCSEKMEF